MVEQTFRCPAYRPEGPGTSPGVCKETGLSATRLRDCPIGAKDCEAITRAEAQGTPGFLPRWKAILEERARVDANRIG